MLDGVDVTGYPIFNDPKVYHLNCTYGCWIRPYAVEMTKNFTL